MFELAICLYPVFERQTWALVDVRSNATSGAPEHAAAEMTTWDRCKGSTGRAQRPVSLPIV